MPAFNAQLRGLDGDTATDFAGGRYSGRNDHQHRDDLPLDGALQDGSILSISASLWPGFEW